MMNKTNFMAYMATQISGFREEQRMGTAHVYQSTFNRVNDFVGKVPFEFKEVTPLWLKAFQNYLLSRQLHWNTISTYMRMLRAVYYRAVDEGHAPYQPRLFKCVYTGTKVTVKRALDEEILRKFKKPITENRKLERARMLFILLFMLRGIPFVDIAFMRRCDLQGNTITYRRRKTGTWLTVHVEPEAMTLIQQLKNSDNNSPYLFPLIRHPGCNEYRQYQNALRNFNYLLGHLIKITGAPVRLSSYSARHSWATIANYRNYQQELISNAMGHSSVKVTETYFKRHTDEKTNEMNRKIISHTFVSV